MCKTCVEEGRMTQQELDEAMAAGDPTVVPINLGDFGGILKEVLGIGEPKDQEAEDREVLDEVATEMLKFVKAQAPRTPDTAAETRTLTQDMAGKIMFTISPQSIAAALAVISLRYRDLLDQWAALYVLANDTDMLGVADLTAPITPEQTSAEAASRAEHAPNTGMYL